MPTVEAPSASAFPQRSISTSPDTLPPMYELVLDLENELETLEKVYGRLEEVHSQATGDSTPSLNQIEGKEDAAPGWKPRLVLALRRLSDLRQKLLYETERLETL